MYRGYEIRPSAQPGRFHIFWGSDFVTTAVDYESATRMIDGWHDAP